MKKQNKLKIIMLLMIALLTTGCTKVLKNKDNKIIKNETTQQNLTENIICRPTDKETIKAYEENGVNIKKLPKCEEFKVTSGEYENLWTSFFVKPLAFLLLFIGKSIKITGKYAISLIIISFIIRLIAYPITKKATVQAEMSRQLQPEIEKISKKYEGKTDEASMMKQQQELLMLFKKNNVNPASSITGCLLSFIQLPLFIAFFEAVQRTPAIFEDKFLGLQLGTTPMVGIVSKTFYSYLILMLIIAFTTYYSFKINSVETSDPTLKFMPIMMSFMIIMTSMFMPSGLGIYWAASNVFTLVQNILVKRSKNKNGKAQVSRKNTRRSN